MKFKATLISLLMIILPAQGKDFGVTGNSWPIAEEGIIAVLKRNAGKLDMAEVNKKMQEKAEQRVNNPPAVKGLIKAVEKRVFYYDPTYILQEDIELPGGKILHKAGTAVNPLDHMNFDRRMFFIDGRDKEQVEWLKEQLEKIRVAEESKTGSTMAMLNRIVLTGGRILELQKETGIEMFFDQAGELTAKFGIKAVPAVLRQEGKMIRITEVNIDEKESRD